MYNVVDVLKMENGKEDHAKRIQTNKITRNVVVIIVFFLIITSSLLTIKTTIDLTSYDNAQLEPPFLLWAINLTDFVDDNQYSAEPNIISFGLNLYAIIDSNGDNSDEALVGVTYWNHNAIPQYNSTIMAIDLETKELIWSFKTMEDIESIAIKDLDDDNLLELALRDVNQTLDKGVCVLNAEDGSELWSNRTLSGLRGCPIIADTDFDGKDELYCITVKTDTLLAFDAQNGTFLWSSNPFEDYVIGSTIFVGNPAIGDFTGDSIQEIAVASTADMVFALDPTTGELMWNKQIGWMNTVPPVLGDINGDKTNEVIVSTGNKLNYALDGKDGSTIWTLQAEDVSAPFPPALGDLNNDGCLDVILCDNSGNIFSLDGKSGKILWKKVLPDRIGVTPVIGDLTNNNQLDVLVRSADGYLYAFNGIDGTFLWRYYLSQHWHTSLNDLYIYDINGDGNFEILTLVDNETSTGTFLYCLDFKEGCETGKRVYWKTTGGNLARTMDAKVTDPDIDMLSSYSETYYETDSNNSDTDEDKLMDMEEVVWTKTDPNKQDTNENGIKDSEEDPDNDGLSNLKELEQGTDPLNRDTDSDLLGDKMDPFPLFGDGWFYWSGTVAIIVGGIITLVIIRKRRRKKEKLI